RGCVKPHALPLIKWAVAGRLDRAEVHEDVLAGLGGDEAKALVGVEPLHGSNSHELVPPSTSRRYQSRRPDRAAARDKLDLRDCEAKREPVPGHGSGWGHPAATPLVRSSADRAGAPGRQPWSGR